MELGKEIYDRVDALAAISAEPGRVTRVFLSPEQSRANAMVLGWMRAAGLSARLDAIGNVVGRYEGREPGAPALALGSHLDTVRDAGRYDGVLGVIAAISCVGALARAGERLPFAIELFGFADEEGVRFGSTLLGSRAVAGTFEHDALDLSDAQGLTMREALRQFGLDPEAIGAAARRREEFLAYVELHIEQGPVLEQAGAALGCVTSINGATRLRFALTGVAGHSGTVPMTLRRDALAGAAEAIVEIERICSQVAGLVGTVGTIEARPGATNVIPGACVFTVDIRAPDDVVRLAAVARVRDAVTAIARRRKLTIGETPLYESAAAPCAPWLMDQLDAAIAGEGLPTLRLSSGAGHDGLAMRAIADIGMIFVRCAGGVSHNPAESITVADAEIAARTLLRFIRGFQPEAS